MITVGSKRQPNYTDVTQSLMSDTFHLKSVAKSADLPPHTSYRYNEKS